MKAQSQGEQPMKKYNGWNDNKSIAGGVGGKPGPFEEQPEQERLWIKIGDNIIKEIDRNILANEVFDIETEYFQFQITNDNGNFSVTNAVDGWGINQKKKFENSPVVFLTIDSKFFVGMDHTVQPSKEREIPDDFYPGKQYQRLFNWLHEKGFVSLQSEMQEVISIVHEDFPGEAIEALTGTLDVYKQVIKEQELEIERLKGLLKEILDTAFKQANCKNCIEELDNLKKENDL